eukprot:gnl/TRDRNA2_/TRDRNA2_189997_c0_seq1.p1 gnl/TRDRNA2_/TRDRNA2_189997_c0~~gnl/TRDRNA2_/TRDRNA2_189997_c0_seq1.p1  ORF type:complete len:114 (+),score=16.97 gnl/TRDRNA2_/TRDRNA2_189997_c0_seq1:73-414(+)
MSQLHGRKGPPVWICDDEVDRYGCRLGKGAIVRAGKDLQSEALSRLEPGAKVEQMSELVELQTKNGSCMRLHYRLVCGNGPAEGWVSVAYKGRQLMKLQAYGGNVEHDFDFPR